MSGEIPSYNLAKDSQEPRIDNVELAPPLLHRNEFEATPEELERAIQAISKDTHESEAWRSLWERSRDFEGVTVREFFPWADRYLRDRFPDIYRDGDEFTQSNIRSNWVANYFESVPDPRPSAIGAFRSLHEKDPRYLPDRQIKYLFLLQDQLQQGFGSMLASWRLGPMMTGEPNFKEKVYKDIQNDDVAVKGAMYGMSVGIIPIERKIILERAQLSYRKKDPSISVVGDRIKLQPDESYELAKGLMIIAGQEPEDIRPINPPQEFINLIDQCVKASYELLPD